MPLGQAKRVEMGQRFCDWSWCHGQQDCFSDNISIELGLGRKQAQTVALPGMCLFRG